MSSCAHRILLARSTNDKAAVFYYLAESLPKRPSIISNHFTRTVSSAPTGLRNKRSTPSNLKVCSSPSMEAMTLTRTWDRQVCNQIENAR